MIVWLNGVFGVGKTSVADELHRRIPDSFVFDPENAGYYIRNNAPASFSEGDFQHIPLWRTINARMLSLIAAEYRGTILVPMTVTDPAYYREITEPVKADGAEVRHFVLYARRETILRRLKKRSLSLKRERFAVDAIDRCLVAFDGEMRDIRVETDACSAAQAAEEIARQCGIALLPDNRGALRRLGDKWTRTLRHIR